MALFSRPLNKLRFRDYRPNADTDDRATVWEVKKRCLIVDDCVLFREGLSQLINGELDLKVCEETGSVQQAIQIVQNTAADLVIANINLEGLREMDLLASIKALSIDVPVLALSMCDEELYAERTLRDGARGYITRNAAAGEFLLAIRRVLAGDIYVSEKIDALFLKRIVATGFKSKEGLLTDREWQVLDLIGRGNTTRDIADRLQRSSATVHTYRTTIKEKMNLRSATELRNFATRWVLERE